MTGKIKEMIETLVEKRSGGNNGVAATTRTKLILKGIDPMKYTSESPDDPAIITQIKQIAEEMGVKL